MSHFYYSDEPVDLRGHHFGTGNVYEGAEPTNDEEDREPGTVHNVFNGPVIVDDDVGFDLGSDIVNEW